MFTFDVLKVVPVSSSAAAFRSCWWLRRTTEQIFVPNHLSRLFLGPGQKVAFVPGPTASRANVGDRGFLSRVEPPTRTKAPPFVPVGGSTRDKRPLSPPPLARLAFGPGTKATFCPGPKGNRDK